MSVIRRRLQKITSLRRSVRGAIGSVLTSRPSGTPIVPPDPAPILYAVQNAVINNSTDTRAWTGIAVYWDYYTASGSLSEIACIFNNWYGSTAGNAVDIANTQPIIEASFEIGGVVAPILFGGNRGRTLAVGEDDVLSDMVPASAFGLQSIPTNTKVRFKCKILHAAANSVTPQSNTSQGRPSFTMWYDPAAVTVSSVDQPGDYVFSGNTSGNSVQRPFGFAPRIVGRHINRTQEVWVGVGDSITQGLMDSASNDARIRGMGWLYRMLGQNNASDVNPVAYCNMGVASAMSIITINHPRYHSAYKYATRGTWMHCTNDFAENGTSNTVATCQTRTTQGINLMKNAAGSRIKKVLVGKLIARTTSTDAWRTTANQTYRGVGWSPGDRVSQFNAWLDTQVGTLFEGIIQWNSLRDTQIPTMWLGDGTTANLTSTDGTHPSPNGYNLMGDEARAARVSMDGASLV